MNTAVRCFLTGKLFCPWSAKEDAFAFTAHRVWVAGSEPWFPPLDKEREARERSGITMRAPHSCAGCAPWRPLRCRCWEIHLEFWKRGHHFTPHLALHVDSWSCFRAADLTVIQWGQLGRKFFPQLTKCRGSTVRGL